MSTNPDVSTFSFSLGVLHASRISMKRNTTVLRRNHALFDSMSETPLRRAIVCYYFISLFKSSLSTHFLKLMCLLHPLAFDVVDDPRVYTRLYVLLYDCTCTYLSHGGV